MYLSPCTNINNSIHGQNIAQCIASEVPVDIYLGDYKYCTSISGHNITTDTRTILANVYRHFTDNTLCNIPAMYRIITWAKVYSPVFSVQHQD